MNKARNLPGFVFLGLPLFGLCCRWDTSRDTSAMRPVADGNSALGRCPARLTPTALEIFIVNNYFDCQSK